MPRRNRVAFTVLVVAIFVVVAILVFG